jgi:hypothetical protein
VLINPGMQVQPFRKAEAVVSLVLFPTAEPARKTPVKGMRGRLGALLAG